MTGNHRRTYIFCGVRGMRYDDAERLMAEDHRVQMIDAEVIFGPDHIVSAAEHALRAFDQARNVCRNLRSEFILYVSGERQISSAIEVAGIKKRTTECAMIIFEPKRDEPGSIIDSMGWKRDDDVLSPKGKRLSKLGINKAEADCTDSGIDIVLERVALVDVMKRR